jgi:cell division protein FtsL
MSPADPRRGANALGHAANPLVQEADTAPRPDRELQPQEGQDAQRHLRLVERQRWLSSRRRQMLVATVIAGAAIVSLALVATHVLIAENQFRLDSLQQRASVQQERYEKLRLQVAQLEAPDRIVSLAEGRLHMVQPGTVTYLPAISATSASAGKAAGASPASTAGPRSGEAASAGPQGSGPHASGPAGRRTNAQAPKTTTGPGPGASATLTAPSGDADWPSIKPYLSGSP